MGLEVAPCCGLAPGQYRTLSTSQLFPHPLPSLLARAAITEVTKDRALSSRQLLLASQPENSDVIPFISNLNRTSS